MPQNYTNHEFMRMREQAIVNAREMQRRAAIKDCPPEHPRNTQPLSDGEFGRNNTLRFEKFADTDRKTKQVPQHSNTARTTSPYSDERMLIMSLLLILVADGADKMLIFALMYIMM